MALDSRASIFTAITVPETKLNRIHKLFLKLPFLLQFKLRLTFREDPSRGTSIDSIYVIFVFQKFFIMDATTSHETYNLNIQTPAGDLTTSVSVPTGFIPITDIIPLMRSLGEQAHQLAVDHTTKTGATISCQKGCAACCRMMIPLAPPEALALRTVVEALPSSKREPLLDRFQAAQRTLREAGLEEELQRLAFSEDQGTDDELEPLNRAYYSLRIPCPFLEDEICSIYEQRPSACRELLVTSPAELCQDLIRNPVNPIPSPFRIGTVLSKLWADCYQGPIRLIPLPIALDWAKARESLSTQTWAGPDLLRRALDAAAKFLERQTP